MRIMRKRAIGVSFLGVCDDFSRASLLLPLQSRELSGIDKISMQLNQLRARLLCLRDLRGSRCCKFCRISRLRLQTWIVKQLISRAHSPTRERIFKGIRRSDENVKITGIVPFRMVPVHSRTRMFGSGHGRYARRHGSVTFSAMIRCSYRELDFGSLDATV